MSYAGFKCVEALGRIIMGGGKGIRPIKTVVGCWCGCLQCCIAKNGGGYTQTRVAKGLKVPCLFMIAEVSIRCQKNPGSWYTPYTRVYPQYTTGCLSGAGYRQLYYLHVNSVTYTLFFIPDYQFQKVFFVSSGNNFVTFFLWRPRSCGGPWATAQFASPLNAALEKSQ